MASCPLSCLTVLLALLPACQGPAPASAGTDARAPAAPQVRVAAVLVPVPDLTRASSFYAGLLGQAGERRDDRHVFRLGPTEFVCLDTARGGTGAAVRPLRYPIELSVTDVDAFHARARKAGCASLDREIGTRDGRRAFDAEDPFGNPLRIVERVAD